MRPRLSRSLKLTTTSMRVGMMTKRSNHPSMGVRKNHGPGPARRWCDGPVARAVAAAAVTAMVPYWTLMVVMSSSTLEACSPMSVKSSALVRSKPGG